MVNKLAEMKVKQDLLVVDKRKNIFNTIGYRSRSAGNSTHRSAATFMRGQGAAGTNSEEAKTFMALQAGARLNNKNGSNGSANDDHNSQ